MNRKNRSPSSIERAKPFKVPRRKILIVCEGECTEPIYFRGLCRKWRLGTVSVKVIGKECGSSPTEVVNFAKSMKLAYKTTWCVMDVEQHPTLDQAIADAQASNLKIALSNPCFEYWYLLHFEKVGTPLPSCKDVQKALNSHYGAYKKSEPGVFDVVYPRTDAAIANSKAVLQEYGCSEDLTSCNPATHVHRVVEDLRQLWAKGYKTTR